MLDIDSFWEYSDPALSEQRFRAALAMALFDQRLEVLTQIARTYSLRQRIEEAHQLLDEVEPQLAQAGPSPQVRYLLERGRTINSAGEPQIARELFMKAYHQAAVAGLEGLAVDAAHMVAITHIGTPDAVAWNMRGLELARGSQDAKARALIPAMLNNAAWDLHESGQYTTALALFEEAQTEWRERAKPEQIQIATWSVARCLRSLGRYSEALALQQALEAEHQAAGTMDGYVFEELAENLLALGQVTAARPYFARAAQELSQDAWFVQHEAARLARLQAQAADE